MRSDLRSCCVVLVLAVFGALLSPTLAHACETCEYYSFPGRSMYCDSVLDGETGAETCTLTYDFWSAKYDCLESGNFCSEVDAGGGSGSGGTGGGDGSGGSCGTTGFCAAQCFSCPGGGGRPAV